MFRREIDAFASVASRRCHIGASLAAVMALTASHPAQAQTFVHYLCADGTPVVAAFYKNDKTARIQVDGKALALPQRLSADGGRYAKGGVSFWIKGQQATLKRPKTKPTICKVQ
jgi:membrane-bound inhibitor of C-type lysozyme